MQYKMPAYAALLLAILASLTACNKPSPFGSELLPDDTDNYIYTDTCSVRFTVLQEDSVITSDRTSTASYFLCGAVKDPVFGKTESDLYALFRPISLGPDFSNTTLDSVVLYLKIDPDGFYGDSNQLQSVHVYQLAETLRWEAPYYSNSSLIAGAEIGSKENFLPRPNTEFNYIDTSASVKAAYLNIPLSAAFGQSLLGTDSLDLTADTLFWKAIHGIKVTAGSASDPGAMFAFDLNDNNFSFIRLYYTRDTSKLYFDFDFLKGNKFTSFKHDYSGSDAGAAIGQPAGQYLFLQSMAGLKVKVEFPYIQDLDSIVVNKAELVLTAAGHPNDNALLGLAEQFILTEEVNDSTFDYTSDVYFSLGSALTGGFGRFGGSNQTEVDPTTGNTVHRYRLTMSKTLQDMVDDESGDIENRTVYINVYPQSRSAMRSILAGPANTSYPAKLSLKYTKLH